MENKLWMVRSGESGYLLEKFMEQSIVAIGWNEIGDISKKLNLEDLKDKIQASYPNYKISQVNNFAGQIFRFKNEFQKGDHVITYNPETRQYTLGKITSDYKFSAEKEFNHYREVVWERTIPRDNLSTKTKNTLGSVLTIFKITGNAWEEILGKTRTATSSESLEDNSEDEEVEETLDLLKENFEAKSHEFIKDKVQALDWEEMEELIAGILRGMGYKTILTPKGPDRGVDIVASPDGLGLENPRIKVEVKHRQNSMGASEIRNFIGGLRPNDKGLYVSTGGFSKDAKYEAERSNNPLTLIDLDLLVHLIVQHYDQFDPGTRSLIPLKRIYWPV